MAEKKAARRRRDLGSEAARAARDARDDEHLRLANELIDRRFAESGEPRPEDSLAFARARLAPPAQTSTPPGARR